MNKKLRQIVLPLTAAVIWGFAFTVQSKAADVVGPFTLNAIRFYIGALVLTAALKLVPSFSRTEEAVLRQRGILGRERSATLKGGILCGAFLAAASCLQQYGIAFSTAGKASFITSLYMVLVAIGGLFLGEKLRPRIVLAVVLAVLGLFFISIQGKVTAGSGDGYLVLCALGYTLQILGIDRLSPGLSGVRFSRDQFLAAALFCTVPALLFEQFNPAVLAEGLWMFLYMGVLSTGVAYTLQVLAQQGGEATVVSLLLCMESVFGLLGGMLVLQERLTGREWLGCGLMLLAVLVTQLPDKSAKKVMAEADRHDGK